MARSRKDRAAYTVAEVAAVAVFAAFVASGADAPVVHAPDPLAAAAAWPLGIGESEQLVGHYNQIATAVLAVGAASGLELVSCM